MPKKIVVDQDVYSLAKERAHHVFDLFDTVAVAFSGGKDSTAVLNIVLEVAHERGEQLPINVIHVDEEASTQDTHDYLARVFARDDIDMRWYCLPFPHQNACSREHAYWWTWDPDVPEKWVRPLPPEATVCDLPVYTQHPHTAVVDFYPVYPKEHRWSLFESSGWMFPPGEYGTVGLVMGIRGQESLTRYQAVTAKKHDNFIVPYDPAAIGKRKTGGPKPPYGKNIWKCYPVYDWSTEDVWTAPFVHGWDYNRSYDKMSMHGIAPSIQRIAPPWTPEALPSLSFYRDCFPELWDRMVTRVPGVNTAVRYATTELYNFGKSRTTKADHLTWEEFIREMLLRLPEPMRTSMANRVAREIEAHHRLTDEPILEQTAHPDTGLSWHFLYMIVSRGDPLERKLTRSNVATTADQHRRQRQQYEEERDRMVAEGRLDLRRRSGNIKVGSAPGLLDTPDEEQLRIGVV